MKSIKSKYQIFDWEAIEFPIVLTEIQSITNHYIVPVDSILEVFRDQDYRLKGILKGLVTNPADLEYRENDEIKEVGFINGETLKAKSNERTYRINGFGISHIHHTPFKHNNKVLFEFECQIYLHDIELLDENVESSDIICDFFLCSIPQIYFNGMTKRIDKEIPCKFRMKFDDYQKSNDDIRYGNSSSWDYSVINYGDEKIIIQVVNKDLLPQNIDGILIEYRNSSAEYITEKFRKITEEYLSFILGTHLQKIGTSSFNYGYKLRTAKSNNPWSRKIFKGENINPIPLYNGGGDRDFFEKMLNKLFISFFNQYDQISFSSCLWKLWVGKSLPIGTDLPILSSGLETLIESYLKKNNLLPKYTKNQKKIYKDLISDEINSIENKLMDYQFKNSVINKLKNPYNFSIGEKMNLFFTHISFDFDKNSIENRALMARNSMAHQEVNLESVKEQRQVKKISDAYITLINRVILKILGYDWYYIDYSKEGIRYLKIEENL